MINPNDYEQMIAMGNQNSGLERQMKMAQSLREGSAGALAPMQTRGMTIAPSKAAAAMGLFTQLGGMAMQHKLGGQMDANKMAQARMLASMMGQGRQAQGPAGPGFMPPSQRQPNKFGMQGTDPMFDME